MDYFTEKFEIQKNNFNSHLNEKVSAREKKTNFMQKLKKHIILQFTMKLKNPHFRLVLAPFCPLNPNIRILQK